MTKRPYDEINNDQDLNSFDLEEFSDEETLQNATILSQILRVVIGRYSRNLKIRKEHIQTVLQKHKIKGNSKVWLSLLNDELKETFGMKLNVQENEIFVTSNLEIESKQVLYCLLRNIPDDETPVNVSNPDVLMSRKKRNFVTVNTIDELQGGLTMIILTIVVLSGNKINELDLLQALTNFGCSENLNTFVPLLNKNTSNVVAELTKREYLKKVSPRGDIQAGAEYSLGKRALKEVLPHDFLDFMLDVVQSEEGQRKARTAITRCFPEFRAINSESGAQNEEANGN